jgi:gliding motility-associated-like protein
MGKMPETDRCRAIRIISCLIFLTGFFIDGIYAEGTKEVIPLPGGQGGLEINKYRNDFGFYDGDADHRINISVRTTDERIRFGLGPIMDYGWYTYDGDMTYRIKDPSGDVVYGPFPVPTSGQTGYIDDYNLAVTGPFSGGYPYLELAPLATGDYYIEFYYPPGTGYSEDNPHIFQFFDITVVDAAGNPVTGRLWSKAWQFWCLGAQYPPSTHRFYGSLDILSDDSIVTKVYMNGIIGGAFDMASNATGCENTGNITADRQSRTGSHTYPKYRVFLNDPDSTLFPTSRGSSGIIPPITVMTGCNDGADFGIRVSRDGFAEVLIQLNPAPGEDPEDVKLFTAVKADPGGNGYNRVHWDGLDNNGNPVQGGIVLFATVTTVNGITHMPLDDIEFNDNGFIVSQIRPPGQQIRIFWDDSRIPGGTTDTLTGCISGAGCHIWNNTVGDLNTVNSWWYVTRNPAPPVPFILHRSPGTAGAISGPQIVCRLQENLEYSVDPIPDAQDYIWAYSGNNVTITGSDSVVHLSFTPSSTSGILSVYGHDSLCGDGPASTLEITIDTTPPAVELPGMPAVCRSTGMVQLTGGTPQGGQYSVDGVITGFLDTDNDTVGPHLITYSYTKPGGCTATDSTWVMINGCDAEQVPVYFPDAFTPDGDGLNDLFRPVVTDPMVFASFHLQVFSLSGQLIFQSRDPGSGWDGTLNGSRCPGDVYAWIASYELTGQKGIMLTLKGTVTLLR